MINPNILVRLVVYRWTKLKNYLVIFLILFIDSLFIIIRLVGDASHVEVLEDIDRNTDPTSPRSPKMRWNVDECHEVILLLTAK